MPDSPTVNSAGRVGRIPTRRNCFIATHGTGQTVGSEDSRAVHTRQVSAATFRTHIERVCAESRNAPQHSAAAGKSPAECCGLQLQSVATRDWQQVHLIAATASCPRIITTSRCGNVDSTTVRVWRSPHPIHQLQRPLFRRRAIHADAGAAAVARQAAPSTT